MSFMALMVQSLNAQENYQKDRETLKKLCGCFEVEFKYKETFGYAKNYKVTDKYINEALEWVSYEEQSDGSVSMQHILVIDSTTLIKHWREDWVFEGTEYFDYEKTYVWNKIKEDKNNAKNKWLQKVYQVDDRVQYAGIASFVYFDNKILWQSQVDAPLPRREYTKRTDYNVMNRLNRLYISDKGYMHEQDNFKIYRNDNNVDTLISEEKGWNNYVKVEESKCQAAIDWWNKNKIFWQDVRSIWNEILKDKTRLDMHWEIDGKQLYEVLFKLNVALVNNSKQYNSLKAKEEIKNIITEYIK